MSREFSASRYTSREHRIHEDGYEFSSSLPVTPIVGQFAFLPQASVEIGMAGISER